MATVLAARMETMLATPTPGFPTRAAREGDAGRRGFRRPGSTVLLGIVLLACATTLLPAQDGRQPFERLSLADGLSQSIVEGILQDRKGFMWFVTEDGLNRYDGYRFVVHRNFADNPNSLSHNELKTIYEDREGILWIGTFEGGLNRFDPSVGQSAARSTTATAVSAAMQIAFLPAGGRLMALGPGSFIRLMMEGDRAR